MKNNEKKLNILVFTQKVDKNDNVLGAFCYWWEKLAQMVNKLNIVCLYKGEYSLPTNVKVFSLGKEKRPSRIKYVWRVYKYFWQLRKKTDVMFIHMNEIYIFLLWPLCKINRVPIVFWKAHGGKLPYAKTIIFLADKIVTSAEKTFEYNTPKKIVIGQGINTDFFQPPKESLRDPTGQAVNQLTSFSVLAVGRPSQIKHYDTLIEAANILINQQNRKNFIFTIVGSPQNEKERSCEKFLKEKIVRYNLGNYFIIERGVPFSQIKDKYAKCDCLVNLTFPESLEKVVLEAMAMEKPVITSADNLAQKLEDLSSMPLSERISLGKKLRQVVVEQHNIDCFIDKLFEVFRSLLV